MKLGTIHNGTRDGQLAVVSRDLGTFIPATGIAASMQAALDAWESCEPALQALYADLNSGATADAQPTDSVTWHSPLPRAYEWIDGSAYINHVVLVRKARNAEPPETLRTDPLIYQGGSGTFLRPTEDITFESEAFGIDFEAEVAVILGDTPRRTKAGDVGRYIRLVTIVNDVTLRNLIPTELAKGFGFFVSKPSTAFAPFACTPDELGDAWQIFLLEDKDEKPTAVVLPATAREGEISQFTEIWLAVLFSSLTVVTSLNSAGVPLIQVGSEVRFLFDGWPALVFSGWPEMTFGTFSGRVVAIDQTSNEDGTFRVLVAEGDGHWPEAVRPGSGARGIALLNRVPVWYELWRQLNGFPPDFYKP
jgi:2-keto-4-pentenoate hydratase/2-oxohepta-3-ene-1,7-dioic acid hydratase in catechol pathway